MEYKLDSVLHFLLVQHRLRLGKYKRDLYSLQKEGENFQAMWSPDGKLIAILVSSSEC
ncbi:hypothetical protein AHAS_Ahas02G0161400 [Arachis hypogaea]